jgi:hypothetical protein
VFNRDAYTYYESSFVRDFGTQADCAVSEASGLISINVEAAF